jgi:hypothetical protein
MAKDKTQIDKFREAAKAIEAVTDDDYDAAVAKVAKAPKLTDDEIKELARKRRKAQ